MASLQDKGYSERLIEFSKAVAPTKSDFAEKLEITPQAFSKYLLLNRLPGPEILSKLNKLGCNINWLLTGIGPMINEIKVIKPRTKPVPILAEVECGVPITNQLISEDVKYVEMADTGFLNNPFIVIARGDSMIPYINPGDHLLCVDEPERIKNGKAVVVSYKSTPDSYMSNAKLVEFINDDMVCLYSVNTKYSPKYFRKSEILKMYKVVRITREVK